MLGWLVGGRNDHPVLGSGIGVEERSGSVDKGVIWISDASGLSHAHHPTAPAH